MMTSLRLLEKITKVNANDVTYGLLEKYDSEGKLTDYVVARNPVEKVGEFVNYTWDSGPMLIHQWQRQMPTIC